MQLTSLLRALFIYGCSICFGSNLILTAAPPKSVDEAGRVGVPPTATQIPLVRVVDLKIGEQAVVELHDGTQATVKLLAVNEHRDPIRDAVRKAEVDVEVNGQSIRLETGMYNLPQPVAGVQIDCTVTSGYNSNGTPEFWGLDKDARLRVWPQASPLARPGSLIYPVKQRWFASMTWFDNQPVDGGATILKKIYYHSGLDIGATEGMTEVIAATDGLVVSSGLEILEEHQADTPAKVRYDVVYLMDQRGWYYRYSHLQSIDPTIVPGRVIQQGDRIGLVGKEGASGGWSHLHFEIVCRQPSGKWGTQAGYALLREAYIRQYQPPVLACARPHYFITAGQSVTLDGSLSWSASGDLSQYEWQFTDGSTATGSTVQRSYPKPGRYSEVLKVTDRHGNIDYDFAVVQVLDPAHPGRYPATLHANYAPSMNVRAGDTITFKVRAFYTQEGEETWDFGDGSPTVITKSDGHGPALNKDGYAITQHRYDRPGHYLVRVTRTADDGTPAFDHLDVVVDPR